MEQQQQPVTHGRQHQCQTIRLRRATSVTASHRDWVGVEGERALVQLQISVPIGAVRAAGPQSTVHGRVAPLVLTQTAGGGTELEYPLVLTQTAGGGTELEYPLVLTQTAGGGTELEYPLVLTQTAGGGRS